MTRAMLAAVLWRMAGGPEPSEAGSFADVESGAWYGNAVLWAASKGFILGYGDGCFGPLDPVTREQLVTVLWRCRGVPEGSGDLSGFADGASVSGWALEAFSWAVGAGVAEGRPGGLLDPKAAAARGEFAQILMRAAEAE